MIANFFFLLLLIYIFNVHILCTYVLCVRSLTRSNTKEQYELPIYTTAAAAAAVVMAHVIVINIIIIIIIKL